MNPTVVGEHDLVPASKVQPSQCGIECGEQAILRMDARAAEPVEEGRLAGVRIADERDDRRAGAGTGTPAQLSARAHPLESLAHDPDALVDEPPIRFELGLSRPAQPDSPLLALQVGPASDEPRRQMLKLCELHLELAFERAGALREDIQYEDTPVQDPASEVAFQVALLGRGQGMVDEHDLGTAALDRRADLVGLAGADEVFRIGSPLGIADCTDRASSGRCRELAKFIEHAARGWLVHVDEESALAGRRSVQHRSPAPGPRMSSRRRE